MEAIAAVAFPRAGPDAVTSCTRRALLGRIASSCVAGAVLMAGCARSGASAARSQPMPANPTTKLVFYAKPVNAQVDQNTIQHIMQEVLAPFYATHRGVAIQIFTNKPPTSQFVADILANQQVDVFHDNYFAPYAGQNLLIPLQTYFQRDQVDPSIWNPAQYALYNTPAGPLAVPTYTGTSVLAVNRGMLSPAGVSYPSVAWTSQDFVSTCGAIARPGGPKPTYGGTIFWWSTGPAQQASWVFRGFGGNQVTPGDPAAPSQLSAPQNLAALDWLYHELFWPQVCVPLNVAGRTQFVQGQCAMIDIDTWNLLAFAQALSSTAVNFDFVPYPVLPAGRATFCTADFYAIAANCKQVDGAWELLRWVSTEPQWQRASFRYALLSPALNSLWEEWATVVQQVAPVFNGKSLQWFGDAASKGYAYPVEYYPYADQQVWTMIAPYFADLYARKLSVTGAARTIDQRVNAFETSARAAAT